MTRAVSILERPVYGVTEAAGLLGLRADRTRAWLDGYERRGVRYPPVVRSEATGDDIVTWGEFVELGYLREYRRKGIPLQQLRPVIDDLRHEFDTPYPLATAKPFLYGRELVLELQRRNGLPPRLAIVIRSGQTIALASETERFLQKVEFHPPRDGDACRLMPAGRASPVVIDPFGPLRPADGQRGRHRTSLGAVRRRRAIEEDRGRLRASRGLSAAVAYEEQRRTLAA